MLFCFLATMQFEFIVPLVKATSIPEQGVLFPSVTVKGIATDQRRDIDLQIVKAAQNKQALDYLHRCGSLNYDHTPELIGKITKARIMGQAEARQAYGTDTVGDCIEIEGVIHAIKNQQHANLCPGLVKSHQMIENKHPLFFSIQGSGMVMPRQADGEQIVYPTIIPEVAVTPHPINVGAVCQYAKGYQIAKSLADVMSLLTKLGGDETDGKRVFFFGQPPASETGYPSMNADQGQLPVIKDAFNHVLGSGELAGVTSEPDGKRPGTEESVIQVSAPPGTEVKSGSEGLVVVPVRGTEIRAMVKILSTLGSLTPANGKLLESGMMAGGPAVKVAARGGA